MRKFLLILLGCLALLMVQGQQLDKSTVQNQLTEAEKHLAKDENQIALDLCNNALTHTQSRSEIAQVKLLQGRAYFKMKLFEKSFEQFSYVLKMTGDFPAEYRATALTWMVSVLTHLNLADLNITILSAEKDQFLDIPNEYILLEKYLATTDDKQHPLAQFARLNNYSTLANNLRNAEHIVASKIALAQWLSDNKEYTQAAALLEEVLNNTATIKDKSTLCILENNLGYVQLLSGNYNVAKRHFFNAWNSPFCPVSLKPEIALNMASLFKSVGDNPNMTSWSFEALTSAQKANDQDLYIKILIANAYVIFSAGDRMQAEELCIKALELLEKNNNLNLLLEAYRFQSTYFSSLNDREEEDKYRQLIASVSEEISQNELEEIRKTKELEQIYWRIYSDMILQISKENEALLNEEKQRLDATNKEQSIQLLQKELLASEYERAQSDKARAIRELEVAKLALDKEQQASKITSLTNERTQQELVMAQLELSKAEKEAALVQADRKNLELEKSDLVRNELLRKAEYNLTIGLVIGLFCIIGIIVSIVIIRRMKANNKLITHQKHELELNAIDIRSSLHSASQFQAALTPRETDINALFTQANYIYYPLDIVSGDLPLCFTIGENTWIAAIDCIGHGVPAAMLTFTAHYTLKDILLRNPNMSPSDVLEQLHRTIILSFDNNDEDAKFHSGMDVSLVKVNKTDNTLEFAGAMSPLILQAKDGSCQVIRGVRRSVADFSTPVDQRFVTHTYSLKDVHRFVLFSDGFIHQLNAQTQKIFSLARLLKIVQEQSNKTTTQLKETLIKEHESWRGNNPQTDDILLLIVEN